MKINQEMVSKQLQILMVVNFWMGGNCQKNEKSDLIVIILHFPNMLRMLIKIQIVNTKI